MQNRPGGGRSIGGLDDPGAGGDGDTGLQKMLFFLGGEYGSMKMGIHIWVYGYMGT